MGPAPTIQELRADWPGVPDARLIRWEQAWRGWIHEQMEGRPPGPQPPQQP